MMIHMGRKILSILIAFMLLFSFATSVFAAESEAHAEPHSHGETEYPIEPHDYSHDHPHDHDCDHAHDDDCDHDYAHGHAETGDAADGEAPAPHPGEEETGLELPEMPPEDETPASHPGEEETEPELPEAPPEQQEIPDYIVLETRSGAAIVMFGTPSDLPPPGISPFLVGSRPCAFHECPNTVTVHTKYDFVCNNHKCSISGCSSPAYYMNPNKCQVHAGLTNIICQIYTPGNPDKPVRQALRWQRLYLLLGTPLPPMLWHRKRQCHHLPDLRQCWFPDAPITPPAPMSATIIVTILENPPSNPLR
jgi:hypothetical protein